MLWIGAIVAALVFLDLLFVELRRAFREGKRIVRRLEGYGELPVLSLFATGARDDWVAKLRGADIVAAPINTLLEASNDPDVLANLYVTEVAYPEYGKTLKVHGTPWQFSETPAQVGTAPKLGAHNDDVLTGLGYTAAQIQAFRERKVI